jgi:hypothetical protein
MLKMALYPLHFYHMNPQVRPAWSKIGHLFVNFLDTWNFTAAVLEELLPVLQTAVVEHAHFRPATGGMRYANMSDQDVHQMIRSDPMISWNLHTKMFWHVAEMERALAMHISIGSR